MAYKIEGSWSVGKAFDLHTVSSTYLGTNEYGREVYDNQRSEMGELLYQLKYKQQPDEVAKIVALLDQIQGIETFDALVPIPPTNKNRAYQPVPLIAEALGVRRNVPVLADLLQNSGTEELKSITDPVARLELLKAAITISGPNRVAGKKVLLIDDLYRSGSTLNVATDIIMSQGKAERVCVLTMTKTRSSR